MKIKITDENTTTLKNNEVFVFGSNLAGVHGAGAAKLAKDKFGAEQGVGEGFTGRCYALPTKDENIETRNLIDIHKSVEVLLEQVKKQPNKMFVITAVGCGLAGLDPKDVAPMFEPFVHLSNVSLPKSFVDVLFPEKIKGYKVTDKNMQCRGYQYTMNKTHKRKGDIVICENGFHFCKNLKDCFNYYPFDPENRVFEVEGSGDMDFGDDKISVRNIKFVRELTWFEVLKLINTGKNNTGLGNSGNWNSGYYNSGDCNSGNYNSGHYNSGDWNSGHNNSGHNNSGNYNSGHNNSGNYNSGHYNSGNRNSGNWNSGNWNSGNYNSGYFNNDTPTIRMFGKDTGLKIEEIDIPHIELPLNIWISESDMTEEEKGQNPKFHVRGGYLKTLSYKEAWKKAWGKLSNGTKQQFLNLPNFDKDIFEDITGIKV